MACPFIKDPIDEEAALLHREFKSIINQFKSIIVIYLSAKYNAFIVLLHKCAHCRVAFHCDQPKAHQ